MQGRYWIISMLGMLLPFSSGAQTGSAKDTVIKGATIEIIQSYKPEVKRAPRPEPSPSLPPVDTTTPVLQYNIPPQTLFFSYGSLPLRPLALDVNKVEPGYANYVKLGGGNLSTIYLDAGIGSLKGTDYETAIHLRHQSQSGSISDQKASSTGVDASGTLHKKGKAFGAQLGVHNNRYHFYGYDHSLYSYNIDAVRQSFTDISLALDMKDELAEGKKFNYHPALKFYIYNDKSNLIERYVHVALPVSYNLDSNLQLYFAANITYTNFIGPDNNIFQLAPGIRFSKGIFTGHAGISPTWGMSGNAYILPDFEVNFALPQTQFMFNAGWQGNLVQNSYKQLTTLNPYLTFISTIQQTHTNEIFAGIKSNIGSHITFNGRISWWQYNNLPVFINDTLGDGKNFKILYDPKVNAIGLQAAIRYQVAQTFSIGFSGQWMNFYKTSYAKLWHRPGVRFTGDVLAQPVKKLSINAYISFIDELYALEKANRTLKLSSILDIGVGAEYEIIKRVNVFVQANNLLNSKYRLWYGYDAFGFNIFGGVRLKF